MSNLLPNNIYSKEEEVKFILSKTGAVSAPGSVIVSTLQATEMIKNPGKIALMVAKIGAPFTYGWYFHFFDVENLVTSLSNSLENMDSKQSTAFLTSHSSL